MSISYSNIPLSFLKLLFSGIEINETNEPNEIVM